MIDLKEFVIFILVAIVRTGLDVIIWRVLVYFFQEESKIVKFVEKFKLNRYSLAQTISFLISMVVSYFSNKYITFQTETSGSIGEFARFVIVSVISLVISVWAINFLTSDKAMLRISKVSKLTEEHWPLISKIATVVLTVFTNYGGYVLFVFK